MAQLLLLSLAFLSFNGLEMLRAEELAGADGAPMVLIPEGPFLRGSPSGQGDPDEQPQRMMYLSPFYLDRYEVINRRYQAFLKATKHRTPEHCCEPSYNSVDRN
ncbi:MAG: hypothetical protein C4293_12740 [Nitrospiraceae bacterium]